jgi:hypothetical protein
MPNSHRTFRVLAPVAGRDVDDQVHESELEGCNVDALVESGHLQPLDDGGASAINSNDDGGQAADEGE